MSIENARYVTRFAMGQVWIRRGPAATRPTAKRAGRVWVDSDGSFAIYRDTGTTWEQVYPTVHLDQASTAEPSTPSSGIMRLYASSATGEVMVKKSNGSNRSLESGGHALEAGGVDLTTTGSLNFGNGLSAAADVPGDRTTVSALLTSLLPEALGGATAGTSIELARADHIHEHGSGLASTGHVATSHDDASHTAPNKFELYVNDTKVGAPAAFRSRMNIVCSTGWVASGADTGTQYNLTIAGIPQEVTFSGAVTSAWTDMPAALTEFLGLTNRRMKADLTNARTARLLANVGTAGSASAELRVQYSTDQAAWSYLDGATGPSVNISSTGLQVSSQVTITPAARADVFLRIIGINGNGTADPLFGLTTLQVK